MVIMEMMIRNRKEMMELMTKVVARLMVIIKITIVVMEVKIILCITFATDKEFHLKVKSYK